MTKKLVYPWYQIAWDIAIADGMDPAEIERRGKGCEGETNVWRATPEIQRDANTAIATAIYTDILTGDLRVRDKEGRPLPKPEARSLMMGPTTPHITAEEGNAWLKKKGYLEQWEPPTRTAETDPDMSVIELSSARSMGLTTPEIAIAFGDFHEISTRQWLAKLGDTKNHHWVLPARIAKGIAPRPSKWCPITLATLLLQRGADSDSLRQLFLATDLLKPWLHQWQESIRERNAFGQ